MPTNYFKNFVIPQKMIYIIMNILAILFKASNNIQISEKIITTHQIIDLTFMWLEETNNETSYMSLSHSSSLKAAMSFQNDFREYTLMGAELLAVIFEGTKIIPHYLKEGGRFLSRQETITDIFERLINLLDEYKDDASDQYTKTMIVAISRFIESNQDIGYDYLLNYIINSNSVFFHYFLSILNEIYTKNTEETYKTTNISENISLISEYLAYGFKINNFAILDFILHQICPEVHLEECINIVIDIFSQNNLLIPLLTYVISKEVNSNSDVQTLFRGSTISVLFLSNVLKVYGNSFAKYLVDPLLQEFIKNPNKSYEIDTNRMEETVQTNDVASENLSSLIVTFMENLIFMSGFIPVSLKKIFYVVYHCIKEKFPQITMFSVSSILFLRLINPVLMTSISLWKSGKSSVSKEKRVITLITKILQNVANNIESPKEDYMKVMKPVIKESIKKMNFFLINLLDIKITSETPNFKDVHYTSNNILFKLILNKHPLLQNFGTTKAGEYPDINDYINKLLDTLHSINREIQLLNPDNYNQLIENKKNNFSLTGVSKETDTSNSFAFSEYMNHATNSFQKVGKTKSNNPLYLLILQKIEFNKSKAEYLHKIILMMIDSVEYASEWDLIVDGFGFENYGLIMLIIKWVDSNCKDNTRIQNLQNIYLLNVSHRVQKIVNFKEERQLLTSFKFISVKSRKELLSFFNPNDVNESVISFVDIGPENFQKVIFNDKPAIFTVKDEYFVLIYERLNDCFNKNMCVVDTVKYSKILSISKKNIKSVYIRLNNDSIIKLKSTELAELEKFININLKNISLSNLRNIGDKSIFKKQQYYLSGSCLVLSLNSLLLSLNLTVKKEALNLLKSMCDHYNLAEHLEIISYIDNKDVEIYKESLLRINKILSREEPMFTLGFLNTGLDCLVNSFKKSDNLLIQFMKPWINNIRLMSSYTKNERLHTLEILERVINFTIYSKNNQKLLFKYVWKPLSRNQEVFVDCYKLISKLKLNVTYNSSITPILARSFIPISREVDFIFKDLSNNFFTYFTYCKKTNAIIDWSKLGYSLSFLEIITQNRCLVYKPYVPKMIILLTMLLAKIKNLSWLNSVSSLIINVVTKLFEYESSATFLVNDRLEDYRKHHILLTEVIREFIEFFKGNNEEIDLFDHQEMLLCYKVVIQEVSKLLNLSNFQTKAKILVNKLAFNDSSSFQSHAIFFYGVVNDDDPKEVKLRKIFEMLSKYSLERTKINITSILNSLCQIHEKLRTNSFDHYKIFWVAVSCLIIADEEVYKHALLLLEKVVIYFYENDLLTNVLHKTLIETLIKLKIDKSFKDLTKVTGLNFYDFFHFSLCTLIFKGCHLAKDASEIATRILLMFANMKSSEVKDNNELMPENFPYTVGLLGFGNHNARVTLEKLLDIQKFEVFKKLICMDNKLGEIVECQYGIHLLPNSNEAVLMIIFLSKILHICLKKNENVLEILFIISFYGEKYPKEFSYSVQSIIKVVTKALKTPPQPLVDLFLYKLISLLKVEESANISNLSILSQIKFNGFISYLGKFYQGNVLNSTWEHFSAICTILSKPD